MTTHRPYTLLLSLSLAACTDGPDQPSISPPSGWTGLNEPGDDDDDDGSPTSSSTGTPTTGLAEPDATTASTDDAPDEPGTSSSTASADESTGAASTGDDAFCGNDLQEDGEECDDGAANDNNAHCTEQCQVNVCGDGLLYEGVEQCDDASGNSDEWGSHCTDSCEPGAFCGDGIVQPEYEACDDGPDNGGMNGDDGVPPCTTMCRFDAVRGFITADVFTGDLGGLDGADEKCQVAAFTAGLVDPEKFRAFLSTGSLSANQRFAGLAGPKPYVLLGGLQFAASYADLVTNGPGDAGISVDELGQQLQYAYVATNTASNGDSASTDHDCDGWTSADKNLNTTIGLNAVLMDDAAWPTWKAEGWWTDAWLKSCDKQEFHLYCLEF